MELLETRNFPIFLFKKIFNLNLFTVRDLFNFPLDWQKQKSKVGSMCYCVGG